MSDKIIQILVVDDHQMVRIGLMTLINSFDNMHVLGEAANGYEAIEMCQQTQPDVILMDIKMPTLDGIEATKRILSTYPDIRVLGLTSFDKDDLIKDILMAGASGCLLKDASREEIREAIINAVTGKVVMSHHTMHHLLHPTNPINPLSDRENDVLKLMIQGMTNQEIADNLFVSQSTVKFHVSNILIKLDVNTRTEAVSYALKNHFFDKICRSLSFRLGAKLAIRWHRYPPLYGYATYQSNVHYNYYSISLDKHVIWLPYVQSCDCR